jgi:cold shock CspA family protein
MTMSVIFRGHNPVNNEIRETIMDQESNDRFALLNNGVTIVARDISKIGATFRLKDYQIVNGCQTSHILYLNRQYLTDKSYLPLKLIVTDDSDVINEIIQGTNRQTEVKLEAFESLAPFQKKLEELYLALGRDRDKPLYYERRSKQYDHLEVGREGIVTLPIQINCFVAMFLNEPHSTHRYYGELLSSYRNRIFSDSHLPITYFLAAKALFVLDRLFGRNRLPRTWRRLKYQMLMVFRIQNSGSDLPTLNSKGIEKYCDALLKILDDENASEASFIRAGQLIEKICEKNGPWRVPPQRTSALTTELIKAASGRSGDRVAETTLIRGKVKWFSDTKGYGFIAAEDGRDAIIYQDVLLWNGIQTLVGGQGVEFTIIETRRGFKVADVNLLP